MNSVFHVVKNVKVLHEPRIQSAWLIPDAVLPTFSGASITMMQVDTKVEKVILYHKPVDRMR